MTEERERWWRLLFAVEGHPSPAGSKRAFCLRKGGQLTGQAVVVDACKTTKSWQSSVKESATVAIAQLRPAVLWNVPTKCPVKVQMDFRLRRPKSHYGTGKNSETIKPDAPTFPENRSPGDLLKLARAIEDALTGVLYLDDAQIVQEELRKDYNDSRTEAEGVCVTVETL